MEKQFYTVEQRKPDDWESCWVFDGKSQEGRYLEWDPENEKWYDDEWDKYVEVENTCYLPSKGINISDFFADLC